MLRTLHNRLDPLINSQPTWRHDVGEASPARLSPAGQDAMIGGHGLRIGEALASAWGWEPVPGGKRVRCELRPERDSRAGDASPTS